MGDIGIVTTVFHGDKVPLQMIAYATPFVSTDPALVSRTVDAMAEKFPAFKAAWKKYNQVYLTNLAVLDSYQMFSKMPVASLSDLKGKKVAGAGMNLRYLQGIGVAGVGGSLVTYYNKLKTGVVDAAMVWAEASMTFKLHEVSPHMLKADIGMVNSIAVTMNADSWAKLPTEVKQVIAATAIAYRDHVAAAAMAKAGVSYKGFKAKGGTIVQMSQADRKAWAAAMPNVAQDWAAGLEKKGVPGKAILAAYMDSMRAANQPILRQWDKSGGG